MTRTNFIFFKIIFYSNIIINNNFINNRFKIIIIKIEDLLDIFTKRSGTKSFLVILEHKYFEEYVFINKISEILLSVRSIKLITRLFRLPNIFRYSDFKEYSIIEKLIYRELV